MRVSSPEIPQHFKLAVIKPELFALGLVWSKEHSEQVLRRRGSVRINLSTPFLSLFDHQPFNNRDCRPDFFTSVGSSLPGR